VYPLDGASNGAVDVEEKALKFGRNGANITIAFLAV
jgi:hypothetical protein